MTNFTRGCAGGPGDRFVGRGRRRRTQERTAAGRRRGRVPGRKGGRRPKDSVEPGEHLCYRCMLGSKPVIMVFAHNADEHLAQLASEIDKKIADNSDKKLSSFINLLGKNAADVKSEAKNFATHHKLENVALVVPEENENGPASYNLSPEADVTVLIYRDGKVAANHALPAGKLDKQQIKAILADTQKILEYRGSRGRPEPNRTAAGGPAFGDLHSGAGSSFPARFFAPPVSWACRSTCPRPGRFASGPCWPPG